MSNVAGRIRAFAGMTRRVAAGFVMVAAGFAALSSAAFAQDPARSERARQDREIVYFLLAPETHSFELYHDVTIRDVGRSTYINVVRAGSEVSNPSALCLDTGEALTVLTLRGVEITNANIDIGEPVKPESEAAVVRFPPVSKGTTTRIRITETYTDPARYRTEGELVIWDRSFGRPRNAIILPAGYELFASSFPVTISLTDDNRIRLDFLNPRNDEVRALVHMRKRP
jgi:hypothetical protein